MIKILNDVSLKDYASFKLDCSARYFLRAESWEDIISGVEWACKEGVPYVVLGSASNVIFGQAVYPGLVIKNARSGILAGEKEGVVRVSSGTLMAAVVDYFVESGFGGLEWAGGLPGTIGGAVRGNAGAFGGEIKDSVLSVRSMAFTGSGAIERLRGNKECGFGYRDSIFKRSGEIVLEVELAYKKAVKAEIKKAVDGCIEYRRAHLPLEYPSAGSFFKNIPLADAPDRAREQFKAVVKNDPFSLIPVAAIVAGLGLMGSHIGGAAVSDKHPNFIINKGGASFSDIIAVAELVEKAVYDSYGIKLEREVQLIG